MHAMTQLQRAFPFQGRACPAHRRRIFETCETYLQRSSNISASNVEASPQFLRVLLNAQHQASVTLLKYEVMDKRNEQFRIRWRRES